MQMLIETHMNVLTNNARNLRVSRCLTTALLTLLVCVNGTTSWAQNNHSPDISPINSSEDSPENIAALTLEAQQLTKTYMRTLKKTLQGSIIASGPAASIKVCSASTPAIEQSLISQHNWHVARTSTRIRNPNNRPDPWERRVLQNFATKMEKGAPIKGLEEIAVVNFNGKPAFRYMKAIPVGNVCLTCHGRKISGSVATAINDHYPSDQAKGYRKGELRGAFTLYKHLN